MADKKISQLTELSATPATGDLIPIVDVSDTTDAASGTTKKIAWSNLNTTVARLSTNSDDTTKSLYTMSSGVPVEFESSDSNTLLYLDETNERVGIGTAAPLQSLHIVTNGGSVSLGVDDLSNNNYPIIAESVNAVVGLFSGFTGGHGSGVQLAEINAGTFVDSWWVGRETSGNGAGSTGNSDFCLYYSETANYIGISTAESRFLTVSKEGNMGVGYSLPEARLHSLVADTKNETGFKVTQQDTTNNPRAVYIVNEGTGVGLELDQNGNGVGLSVDVSSTGTAGLRVQNASAVRTGTGGASLVYILNDEPTGSGDVFTLRTDASSKAFFLDDNGAGLSFEIDKDVTNASQTGTTGHSLRITNTNVVNDAATYTKSGAIVSLTASVTETSGTITDSAIVLDVNQTHADATGSLVDLDMDGTGKAMFIDHDDTGTNPSLDIDRDGNNAAKIFGAKITVDNAGAGGVGGIDFSGMTTDEAIFKGTADAITSVGTISHQIPIDIGGTIYYLVAYTHGS